MSQTSLATAAEPMIEVADLWKSYGALEVLKGISLERSARHRACPHRTVRLRKIDAPALRQPSRGAAARARARRRSRRRLHGRPPPRRPRARRVPHRDRHGVPALQPLSAHDRARQCQRRPADREARAAAGGQRPRHGAPRQGRARRQGGRLPVAPVGRPAAARRDRAGACHEPGRDPVRRGHLGARPGARRRSAGRDPRARRGGHDHGAGHARDGLRPRSREDRRFHERRRDRRDRRRPARSWCARRTSARRLSWRASTASWVRSRGLPDDHSQHRSLAPWRSRARRPREPHRPWRQGRVRRAARHPDARGALPAHSRRHGQRRDLAVSGALQGRPRRLAARAS